MARALLLLAVAACHSAAPDVGGEAGELAISGGVSRSELPAIDLRADGRNGLADAIDAALAGTPVMVGVSAAKPVVDAPVSIMLERGVDRLAITLGGFAPPPDDGEEVALSHFTLHELDDLHPNTSFPGHELPNGWTVDLYLPSFSVFRKETLQDLTPNGVGSGIDTDGDGVAEDDWHIYTASMLLTDDLVTTVVFLGKPFLGDWDGQSASGLRPYEPDLQFLCLKTSDPLPGDPPEPRWFCSRGAPGEGVLGMAYRPYLRRPGGPIEEHPGARPFYAGSIEWGPNRWDAQWLFGFGLGAIVTRAPDLGLYGQSTHAAPFAWGVNPNDHDGSESDKLEKAHRYLAAVAVKSFSNRKDIAITPYEVTTGRSPIPGLLNAPEQLATDPAAADRPVPPVPCDLFGPCPNGGTGAARDCGWVPDELYACDPGQLVTVGMGANPRDCAHPIGVGAGDTALRVCDGAGGCRHGAPRSLGESDDECGSTHPAVSFTCPASGKFSVLKTTHDSADLAGLPADAPGGGVPGAVGAQGIAPAKGRSVLAACLKATSGDARECGWTAASTLPCTPGEPVTYGVANPSDCDSPLGAAGGDLVLRVCDGRAPCTFTSPRRLGHADDSCGGRDPGVTFTCGPSGLFTAMVAPYQSADPLPSFTAGVIPDLPVPQLARPDVASSGELQNGILLSIALDAAVTPAVDPLNPAGDDAAAWGLGRLTGSQLRDPRALGLRMAARHDRSSGWTRAPSHEPPAGPCGERTVAVRIRATGQRDAFLIPVGGARFEPFDGMEEAPLPAFSARGTIDCDGVRCCRAQAGRVGVCTFTAACDAGITFEAREGPLGGAPDPQPVAIHWSGAAPGPRATVVSNHDQLFIADFRSSTAGNLDGECGDGICQGDETPTTCPQDCANPAFPDIDLPFDIVPPGLTPPVTPDQPVDDHQPPVLTLPATIRVDAVSEEGAPVTFEVAAHDDQDGTVPVACNPPSGAWLPAGTTTVVCAATDSADNTATGTFTVQVVDLRLELSDLTVPASGPNGTPVWFDDLARFTYASSELLQACVLAPPDKLGDPAGEAECDRAPGSLFPIGTTLVTCRFIAGELVLEDELAITVVDPP